MNDFTITAEIIAHSLANRTDSDRLVIYYLCDGSTRRADNLTICCREKQIDDGFSRVCPVIENGFHHNNEVCGLTLLSP